MSEANKSDVKEPLIQTWAIWIAVAVFLGALSVYAIQFSWGSPKLSPNPETWGQLGDFLGGMVNPIIGLITIWLLAASLKQNQIALQQSKLALDRAEEEVRLTREALEQSQAIQKATEDALNKQIEIAAHARDMNNAIALWTALDSESLSIEAREGTDIEHMMNRNIFIYNKYIDINGKRKMLKKVMNHESERIISKYDVSGREM